MSPVLKVEDLRIRFGSHEAVRGLSFQLGANETLAVVGESGSGKTATALSIMRLLPPTAHLEGRIDLLGHDILTLPPAAMRQLRGQAVSMVFQEPMSSLNPVMTVGDQIAESIRVHAAATKDNVHRRMLETLDLVRLPDPISMATRYPHELSGGMRQRVMIAIAIANRPKLLIADEPTTALDVTIQGQILTLLDNLRRELSMGLLFITHDLGLVARWADRVLVMREGRKVEEAPASTLLTHPAEDYTKHLLAVSPDFGSGRHYSAAAPTAAAAHAPLLSVRDLAVGYGPAGRQSNAIKEISLDINRGEIVGLVGESGSGKSTLGKAILRLIPPSAGEVTFDGVDIARLRGEGALRPFRRRMQMVFQDPATSLNPRQSVADILHAPLSVHGVKSRADRERRVGEVLDRVGLARRSAELFPHEFSGGQRQRIGIARALLLKPDLVICDEPVSALDVSIQAQILALLLELKRDLNLSYLFISHDLAIVRYMADRVIVMQAGRIVEHGDAHAIWTAPQHPYTRTLLAAVSAARGDKLPA